LCGLLSALPPAGLGGRDLGLGRALSTTFAATCAAPTAVGTVPAVAPAVPVSVPLPARSTGVTDVLDLFGLQARVLATLVRGQFALGALGDVEGGEQVRGGGVGLLRLGHPQVERAVDELPTRHLLPVHEGDGG